MKPLLIVLLLLAGCATPPPPKPPPLSASKAKIALGNTKAQVRATLGKTNEVAFDSGYEVWVYRQPPEELVLLFDPSGVLAKTRLR
jgi:hypothetical protein